MVPDAREEFRLSPHLTNFDGSLEKGLIHCMVFNSLPMEQSIGKVAEEPSINVSCFLLPLNCQVQHNDAVISRLTKYQEKTRLNLQSFYSADSGFCYGARTSNYKTMKASPTAHVGILAFLPTFAFAQPHKKESGNVWAQAEAKIEAHLKSIDPKMRSVEIKSERLKKYLPESRVFVRYDRGSPGRTRLVLVNQDAEIADLGDESWHGDVGTPYFQVSRLTEFVRARKIQVKTREDAVEFTRFFEDLQEASGNIASLLINTKDFAGVDKRIMETAHPSADWKYASARRQGGWKVMVKYVGGPSVSIMMPPTYEVDIDELGHFRDLRRYDSSARGLRA